MADIIAQRADLIANPGNKSRATLGARMAYLHELAPTWWWDEAREWWPIHLLRKAAADKDQEGYNRLLAFMLNSLNARPPEGVLRDGRLPAGRPKGDVSEQIRRDWEADGGPRPVTVEYCDKLAAKYYPIEFERTKRNPPRRKNLRDKIRSAIQRHPNY